MFNFMRTAHTEVFRPGKSGWIIFREIRAIWI